MALAARPGMATIFWLWALAVLFAGLVSASTPVGGGFAGAAPIEADVSCGTDGAGVKRCGGSDGVAPDPEVRRIIHATSLVAALADGALAQLQQRHNEKASEPLL